MFARRPGHCRWGRHVPDSTVVLLTLLLGCVLVVNLYGRVPRPDPQTVWERMLTGALGFALCVGSVLGLILLGCAVGILRNLARSYHGRRLEARRTRLQPITQDARGHATVANLMQAASVLNDPDDEIKHQALAAAFILLRADPTLAGNPRLRDRLERALLDSPGFPRTLAESPADADLLQRVTLGAKVGAGTCEKHTPLHATSDPLELASWINIYTHHDRNQEVQVSIGYDTGNLPSLEERGRFIALYLFIATTDLQRFMALMRRPPRDPNAAYGLLIRGDVVEVRYPGQCRGRRLDYVFPLPARLSTANLAGLIREIQLLNLGLLVACAADAGRALLPGPAPAWLDARRQAIAGVYRDFERSLVSLLRRHDRYREPECIHKLAPADHVERVRAFRSYRLEECLYPHYSWVVPLYDADTRWDRLLEPLRAVEAMLLHQGEVPGREVTRGVSFIGQVRQLGYQTATAIEEMLAATELPVPTGAVPVDPFIDPKEESATRNYLAHVGTALALGWIWPEQLPDPETFRRAAAYYEVEIDPVAFPREMIPEVDP
jgi:hypothetical protein